MPSGRPAIVYQHPLPRRFEPYVFGCEIPTANVSISLENVATNHNADPSSIVFTMNNNSKLCLIFTTDETRYLGWDHPDHEIDFYCSVQVFSLEGRGCVPILGPIEHEEHKLQPETVVRALNTHRASRHFRNYWRMFPNQFDEFAALVADTWSGMQIGPPEEAKGNPNVLVMFCEEARIPREMFWSGFAFSGLVPNFNSCVSMQERFHRCHR